jgi:hypothetical protein
VGVLVANRKIEISIKCKPLIKYFVFCLLVWSLVSFTTYRVWIRGADHRDFYPRWAGVRSILEGSKDLYSVEATEELQLRLYQSEIPDNQDQQGFAYPAYLVPLLLPFGFIGDVEVATAIWVGFSVILFIISLVLVLKQNGRPLSFVPVLLFLLWFYPLLMFFQAQMTGLILASLGIGFWAYREGKDLLAGFLLSIGFVKPELVIVPVFTLLLLGVLHKRLKFLLSFILGGLLIFLTSIILVGWWVPEWIMAIKRYSEYAKVTWPLGSIWQTSPILYLLFVLILLAMFFRLRRDVEVFFASSIPIQMLLFPQTLIYGLTMMCLPLILGWKRKANLIVGFVWLLGWVMPLFNTRFGLWGLEVVIMSILSLMVLFIVDKSYYLPIKKISIYRFEDLESIPLWNFMLREKVHIHDK